MNLKVKKSTKWIFLSFLIYKVTLDLSYILVISKLFSYAKLGLDVNNIKLLEAYFLFFLVLVFMPKSSKKLSSIMLWLLILISYIPMLTLFALKDESRAFMYASTGFWLGVFFMLSYIPKIPLRPLKESRVIRPLVFICSSIFVLSIVYVYLGFSFNFNLRKVYEIRSRYVEMGIPMAGYLLNWQASVLNPVFFAIFLAKRKWLYVLLIVAFQFFLFSCTGNKTFLFAIPSVLIFRWILNRKNPLAFMAMGLAALIFLGIISYTMMGDIWVSSLFTRRTMLVPAQLYFLYYDFFSKNGPIYLSTTRIFRSFVYYPYDLSPAKLIGYTYFNKPEMSANTGLVGDAYMNFGFVGLALWGILLALILKSFDICSKNRDIKIAAAAIVIPVVSLQNGGLLTNVLTHGLLLALVILYLLPKKAGYIIVRLRANRQPDFDTAAPTQPTVSG